MEQDLSNPSSIVMQRNIIPPDIHVTDVQGNVKPHSEFSSYMDVPNRPFVSDNQFRSMGQRSHTFTTLTDACEHSTQHLQGSQELSNINNSIPPNGFFSNFTKDVVHTLPHRTTENIFDRLTNVLDSHPLDFQLSPSAKNVKLNHSNEFTT